MVWWWYAVLPVRPRPRVPSPRLRRVPVSDAERRGWARNSARHFGRETRGATDVARMSGEGGGDAVGCSGCRDGLAALRGRQEARRQIAWLRRHLIVRKVNKKKEKAGKREPARSAALPNATISWDPPRCQDEHGPLGLAGPASLSTRFSPVASGRQRQGGCGLRADTTPAPLASSRYNVSDRDVDCLGQLVNWRLKSVQPRQSCALHLSPPATDNDDDNKISC